MFWQKHQELLQSAQPFALVVLTETLGSAPQEAGAKMLCDVNGLIYGTIGGGKVEALALKTAAELLTNKSATAFVDWHLEKDVGMTCGGRVKLYFETYASADWPIAIFGAGHVAQALVSALLPLKARLLCVDARAEWLAALPDSAKLEKRHRAEPAQEIHSLPDNAFVLMMTQGHATDLPVLLECLKRERPFPYVGVIGSKSKRSVLVNDLIAAGINPTRAEQFFCPIGMPIGKSEPAEIAVSIVAQLLQLRDTPHVPPNRGDSGG